MNLEVIVLFIVGLAHLLFGFYVFNRDRKKVTNRLFFLSTIFFALWNLSMASIISGLVANNSFVIILDRLTYFAIPFLSILLIFYSRHLLTGDYLEDLKNNKIIWFLVIYGLINIFLLPSDMISVNMGSTKMALGSLFLFFGIFVGLSAIYLIYNITLGWYKERDNGRKKLKYIYALIGFSLTALGGIIFNVVLPVVGLSAYPALGGASSFFIVLFMGLGTISAYVFGTVITFVIIVFVTFILVAILFAAAIMAMLVGLSVFY